MAQNIGAQSKPDQPLPSNLFIWGFGYSGRAIAKAAVAAGIPTFATARKPKTVEPEPGVTIIPFDFAHEEIAQATHIISTIAPQDYGDPVLALYAPDIVRARKLSYIGYLSTTGVYGNRDGGWVDEETPPAPDSPRAIRRVKAEAQWIKIPLAIDIFRLAGIYGPGRSMFDDLRAGTARRIVKSGHMFGRIHRDDISHGVMAAIRRNPLNRVHVFNFTDDVPAASADVMVEAARLLGVDPPPSVKFADALPKMSPMAASFWADNRRVANTKTKVALNIKWKYPSYREGLRAILTEEKAQGLAKK